MKLPWSNFLLVAPTFMSGMKMFFISSGFSSKANQMWLKPKSNRAICPQSKDRGYINKNYS